MNHKKKAITPDSTPPVKKTSAIRLPAAPEDELDATAAVAEALELALPLALALEALPAFSAPNTPPAMVGGVPLVLVLAAAAL
jgi:hypothetical protein